MIKGTILGLPLYLVMGMFLFYSMIGWIYESTFVSVREHKFVNRGFLNGPIIPIYGCGGTLIYLVFYNEYMNQVVSEISVLHILLVFFLGIFFADVLEYVTSYSMELMFHIKLWDYSDYPHNLNGRISVRSSILWGVFSVLIAYGIQPPILQLLEGIKRPLFDIILYIAYSIALVDLIITTNATIQLPKKLDAIKKVKEELYEISTALKWYDKKEAIKEKFKELKIKNSRVGESLEIIYNSFVKEKIYQRMFRAFPGMKMKKRQELLADFKARLSNIRRSK